MKEKKVNFLFIFFLFILFIEFIFFIFLIKKYKKLQEDSVFLLEIRKKYIDLIDEIEFQKKKKILVS